MCIPGSDSDSENVIVCRNRTSSLTWLDIQTAQRTDEHNNRHTTHSSPCTQTVCVDLKTSIMMTR